MQVMKTRHTEVSLGFRDKDHPIWGILKPLVNVGVLTVVLWLTSSNFDETEIKTIVGMLLANFGLEGINAKQTR
jgi:hypothetical protein